MSTRYRPYQQMHNSDPPGWILIQGMIVLAACIIALPAGIAGFLAQKLIPRFEQERWNGLLWIALSVACIYYFYRYQGTLSNAITQELTAYVISFEQHWFNITLWNWQALWTVTEPIWIRTILAFPLIGLWQEVSSTVKPGQTAKRLKQQEHRRQRRNAGYQRRARRQVIMPELVPDEVNGLMIIGVPIKEEEE